MRNRFAVVMAFALGTGGCLMAGNYQSAKPLGKGIGQFGLTFSTTRYEHDTTDTSTGQTTREAIVLPNLIPEVTYHLGINDDVDVGGRVALGSLGLEADVKFRVLHSDKLHLAIAPALGYLAFVVVEGVSARLPGILTYELADNIDLNLAAFVSTTKYSTTSGGSSDFDMFSGTLLSSGGAVGFDLHGETFTIRPSVEFTRYLYNFNAGSSNASDGFNTVNVMVHIAWTLGKEKQQLNRIENKIDRLSPPPPGPQPPLQGPNGI
jgi:hypothetical protein